MSSQTEDVSLIGATRLRRGRMAPKQARAAVAWWLADDRPTLPDVQQVVSELVANACEHVEGGTHREWVTVSVSRGDGFFRVEVTDPGAFGAEPHLADPKFQQVRPNTESAPLEDHHSATNLSVAPGLA